MAVPAPCPPKQLSCSRGDAGGALGVTLARAPGCVAPNLPARIKGSATHAAALSSHITHTTATLHCDNGV